MKKFFVIDIIEYAGHARDFVQKIELSEWSGIVVASGDGLVYEVSYCKICRYH
jgi:sphingosine kinase